MYNERNLIQILVKKNRNEGKKTLQKCIVVKQKPTQPYKCLKENFLNNERSIDKHWWAKRWSTSIEYYFNVLPGT